MSFKRKCPNCESSIMYKEEYVMNRAIKKNSVCHSCASSSLNPYPFTKKEFCKLYYVEGKTFAEIFEQFNFYTHLIGGNGISPKGNEILKKLDLINKTEFIRIKKKRFVTKNFYCCPVTGICSDYLIDGDYNKAYRNLTKRLNDGGLMRPASSWAASSPKLSIKQLRLRYLLEKFTNKTICSSCVEKKIKKEMATSRGLNRTCKECALPKQRENAKIAMRKKRKENPKLYRKRGREWRIKFKKEDPEGYKKFCQEQRDKYRGKYKNKPLSPEETYWRRLLVRCIKVLEYKKTKSTKEELGFTKKELIDRVGPKPSDIYQLDHNIPVNWFKLETPPSIVNSLDNLKWREGKYNSFKQNRWFDNIPLEYLVIAKPFIKEKFYDRFVINNNIVQDKYHKIYKEEYFNN